MDVSFREDENRAQQRNAVQNLALLRRVAVTLLKRHPSKDSIASKSRQGSWDTDFLEEILRGSAKLGNE
jgi:hypothetical protein